jgi:hypothetical protein
MWTGLYSLWKVPAQMPIATTDQAMLWSTKIVGAPKSGANYQVRLEAGVSYGPWPKVDGLTSGSYYAWARAQVDASITFYTTPVRVQPGDVIEVAIRLVGVSQLNPGVPSLYVPIYDPLATLLWDISLDVEGATVTDTLFHVSTPSLGLVTWTGAFPGNMSIWNMPGTGVSTCGEALPPDGSMAIGPFEFATSDPNDPTTLNWGPCPSASCATEMSLGRRA